MNFTENYDMFLSEEHTLLRQTVRDRAEERIAPVAEELDREHRFTYDIVTALGELGLMGIPIPERHGGGGGDTLVAEHRQRPEPEGQQAGDDGGGRIVVVVALFSLLEEDEGRREGQAERGHGPAAQGLAQHPGDAAEQTRQGVGSQTRGAAIFAHGARAPAPLDADQETDGQGQPKPLEGLHRHTRSLSTPRG